MSLRTYIKKNILLGIAAMCAIFCFAPAFSDFANGYVMGSSGYRMESDDLNAGGTSFSTSSSYSLGSTVGGIATGNGSSSVYRLDAGFWHPDDSGPVYISLTSPADANLGAISGLLGGTGDASSTWLVTTNNPTGYTLSVQSSTYPALKAASAGIPNYAPAGADPDFAFSVPATTSAFGFTVEGSDVVQRFRDNGSACNAGSSDATDACWDGFATTSKSIASANASNHPFGTETVLKYRVMLGASTIQESSSMYEASITVTAITL